MVQKYSLAGDRTFVPVSVDGDFFSRVDSFLLFSDRQPTVVAPVLLDRVGKKIYFFNLSRQFIPDVLSGDRISVPDGRYNSFCVSSRGIYHEPRSANIMESLLKIHDYDVSRIPFKRVRQF